jgi:Flp pilus assembly pilin Flp
MRKNNRAQMYLEYAVLIALAAAALIAMRLFFGRAVQAKYREAADVFGQGEQYEMNKTQMLINE